MRNSDGPNNSTVHAMSHWVELETAVGVKISGQGEIEFVTPFGIEVLFANTITINSKRPNPIEFKRRIKTKRWLVMAEPESKKRVISNTNPC